MAVLKQQCAKGHSQIWPCHQGLSAPTSCEKCERERKATEKRARKAAEDQQRRDAITQRHLKEVAEVQEEIDKITQGMKDERLNVEQENVLAQKRKDLIAAKELANRMKHKPSLPQSPTIGPTTKDSTEQVANPSRPSKAIDRSEKLQKNLKICLDHNVSPSKTEWQRQKDQENANNPAIDKIMEMIGLEDVKSQVLRIKSKVETSVRQGTDLKKERLGLVLLGNPGTGMSRVIKMMIKCD
jgi:hypothetical protein